LPGCKIRYPPNLVALTLNYFDDDMHKSLLKIPKSVTYLKMNDPIINDYIAFVKAIAKTKIKDLVFNQKYSETIDNYLEIL
jgi:hypothetical protein